MLYVIDRRNRQYYQAQLEEMFRIRHRIYVEQRKWKALEKADKREIDQFDTEEARYLLEIDQHGSVQGGVRLTPTIHYGLMRDVFPHLVERGSVPAGENILEMTRYFLTTEPTERGERRRRSGQILCAMFEYGIAAGVESFSLVCDAFFLPTMLECGFQITHLGLPQPYDEGVCIAVLFSCDAKVLASTAKARGVTGPALTYSERPPPADIGIPHAIAA